MQNYNDGYVVDVPYENHFFKDLTPNFLRTLLVLNGTDLPPRKGDEPLRYLELGYGQGTSLNINAAANAGEFWGTDFNPEHSLVAKAPLHHSKVKVQILNDSFAELEAKANNGTLPQFDIITLHGIWSWISPENQEHIMNIISKNLKAGGVVYVSYNCMPGWSHFTPAQELLSYHAHTYNNPASSSTSKIQNSHAFLSSLEKAGAKYFTQNPLAAHRLKTFSLHSASYLAHEYLNQHWDIPYFKDIASTFEKSKCSFLTSTKLLTQLAISLPPEIIPILNETKDVKLRETIRDFALNTQFRCDLFIKGKIPLDKNTSGTMFLEMKFALACQIDTVRYSIKSSSGTIQLKEELYKPFIEHLAANNYTAKSLLQLKSLKEYDKVSMAQFVEIIHILLSAEFIHPAQDTIKPEQKESCKHINTFICQKALKESYVHVLASPLLGGGVNVPRIEQIFLYAKANGVETAPEYAYFTDKLLKEIKQNINVDGKKLSDEDALKHIESLATNFEEKRLPFLKAMGIELNS